MVTLNIYTLPVFLILYFIVISKADADWSTWGTWFSCSTTCGYGVRTRERTCTEGQCIGHGIMHTTCFTTQCEETEQPNLWSHWSGWSECTQTCGGGTRTRTRTCSSGNVTNCCESSDEHVCTFEHSQSRPCINEDCYGTWSAWRSWGQCSESCGTGQQDRTRVCEPEGTVCIGSGSQTRACYVQCLEQERIIKDMDERKTCFPENPCNNDGLCASNGDHVTCICRGNWRGRDCTSSKTISTVQLCKDCVRKPSNECHAHECGFIESGHEGNDKICNNPQVCLDLNDTGACINKEGIFHVCGRCRMFIICSRGRFIPMTCTDNRIWTGDRCQLPSETNVLCLEQ